MEPQMTAPRHEQALTNIALCIRECPDTGGGVQLRRLLWSLYNQHHVVNLWTLVSRLDSDRRALASEVLTAALVGDLKESELKRALVLAGEMARWEETQPGNEAEQRLDEIEGMVSALVRSIPPGRAHTDLVSLHRRLADVRSEWRLASQEEPAT